MTEHWKRPQGYGWEKHVVSSHHLTLATAVTMPSGMVLLVEGKVAPRKDKSGNDTDGFDWEVSVRMQGFGGAIPRLVEARNPTLYPPPPEDVALEQATAAAEQMLEIAARMVEHIKP